MLQRYLKRNENVFKASRLILIKKKIKESVSFKNVFLSANIPLQHDCFWECWVQVTDNSTALFFLLFSEPIIKPVKTKKFSLMEQTLPVTVYEME